MKLYVDATNADRLWLGLERRQKCVAESFSLSSGKGGSVLALMDLFLLRHRAAPSGCTHLYVAAGPGRFTSLRVTAVIANCWAFVHSTQLFAVPSPASRLLTDQEKFSWCRKHGRPRAVLKPAYGKQPNITKPKARQHSFVSSRAAR